MPSSLKQFLLVTSMLLVNSLSHAIVPISGGSMQATQAVGVIVKLRNDTTPLAIAKSGGQPHLSAQTVTEMKVVAAANLSYKRAMSQGAHVLNFSHAMSLSDAQAIAERLMTMANVEYAMPNIVYTPMLTTPNDLDYSSQWSLHDAIAGANLPLAWDTTTGSNSVPIAVIDTGYTRHDQLDASNFATAGYDFISNPTEAGDGDGRDPDARDEGDFCSSDSTRSSWHGTAVMSIIGAITNDLKSMAGINWHANMIPVRVLGRCGGTGDDLIDAIRWAAGLHVAGVPDNPAPAKVINMSLGSVTNQACDPLTQAAIDDAHAAGAVLIAAAGNNGIPAADTSPANCNHVLAIAAHDQNGDLGVFAGGFTSNYGSAVALSAPGVNIEIATCNSADVYTCDNQTATVTNSGTSLSAPMVSGVASLILSADTSVNNYYVESILRNSARAFPTNSTCIDQCGSGMLDAAAALAMLKTFTSPATQIGISKDSGGATHPWFWLGLGLMLLAYRRRRKVAAMHKHTPD